MKVLRWLARVSRNIAHAKRPIVLLYHRIAGVRCDPWQLAVSPDNLIQQLSILTKTRKVVPLSWLVQKARDRTLPSNTAAVSFDDGYADFAHSALPILERFNVPATLFISTKAILDGAGFWWDALSNIILETPLLPDALSLKIGSQNFHWRLATTLNGQREAGMCSRDELHVQIHRLVRLLTYAEQRDVISHLTNWAGIVSSARATDRSLTQIEIANLAKNELVEIGAHTVSHSSLPAQSLEVINREVQESRRHCWEMTGRNVYGFSYPYGDVDDRADRAVQSAGFHYACTTQAGTLCPRGHIYRIPRICVGNAEASTFQRQVLCYG
jgi:peptidoglycan/xylan/chitin deacetylase (PgdA/CDA1 family)